MNNSQAVRPGVGASGGRHHRSQARAGRTGLGVPSKGVDQAASLHFRPACRSRQRGARSHPRADEESSIFKTGGLRIEAQGRSLGRMQAVNFGWRAAHVKPAGLRVSLLPASTWMTASPKRGSWRGAVGVAETHGDRLCRWR